MQPSGSGPSGLETRNGTEVDGYFSIGGRGRCRRPRNVFCWGQCWHLVALGSSGGLRAGCPAPCGSPGGPFQFARVGLPAEVADEVIQPFHNLAQEVVPLRGDELSFFRDAIRREAIALAQAWSVPPVSCAAAPVTAPTLLPPGVPGLRAGLNQYLAFCREVGIFHPFPLQEFVLELFVALRGTRLSVATLRTYLAGLQHFSFRFGFPTKVAGMHSLGFVLRGLRRSQADCFTRPPR